MSFSQIENISIRGIACTLPKDEVQNSSLKKDFENILDSIRLTGVDNRRVCNQGLDAKSMAFDCSNSIIEELKWERESIDVLIYISQSSSMQYPADGNYLKQELNLRQSCLVIDINQGCSAFVYGLYLLGKLLDNNPYKRGLLVLADELSKHIEPKDIASRLLFSDAASATALEYSGSGEKFYFNLESDGKDFLAIHKKHHESLAMNGIQVFQKSLAAVPANFEELLEKIDDNQININAYVLHQANKMLIESILRRIKIPMNKSFNSIEQYGNTSSSSIPISICEHRNSIDKNNYIALLGFGVGMSWGSGLVKLQNCTILPVNFIE